MVIERSELVYYSNMIHTNIIEQGTVIADKSWNYKNTLSPFHRLYFITSGSGVVYNTNQKVILKNGYFYFIPAGIKCNYCCENAMTQIYFHFEIPVLPGLDLFEKLNNIEVCKYSEEKIINMVNILDKKDFSSVFRLKNMLDEVLYILIDSVNPKYFEDLNLNGYLNQKNVIQYIEQNLSSQLRVSDIAKSQNISTPQLFKNFKSDIGTTLKDYISAQLIKKAKQLLLSTTLYINQISDMLGFSDAYYFSRFFSKHENLSPREFRKSHRLQ